MSHAVLTALAAWSTKHFVCEGTLLGSIGGGGQDPGSTVRMSTSDLAASDTGDTCRQYPIAVSTENTTMTGMLMTAADGLGMNCVALPWACPELFAECVCVVCVVCVCVVCVCVVCVCVVCVCVSLSLFNATIKYSGERVNWGSPHSL
jgi:hypothetical protein